MTGPETSTRSTHPIASQSGDLGSEFYARSFDSNQKVKKVRIGLVGCVSTKLSKAAQAKDLYNSTLFRGRRSWVERTCDTWFILSAKYGLVLPTQVIEPYDVSLTDAPTEFKHDWANHVFGQLEAILGDLKLYEFEIHAGSAYREFGLVRQLMAKGAQVSVPAEGLKIGPQLEMYVGNASHTKARFGSIGAHPASGAKRSSYQEIGWKLLQVDGDSATLSMSELEELIGRFLPNSARNYREWWANTERSPQARGWLSAGWRVENVDRERELVHFTRNPEGYVPRVGRRPKFEGEGGSAKHTSGHSKEEKAGIFLDNLHETGEWNYVWPKVSERFSRSFVGELHIGEAVYDFRHAIGERYVFGNLRTHTVTFLNGRPVVEGAGCDDFRISKSLVSFIRGDGGYLLDSRDDMPTTYREFDVVFQKDEIASPDAKDALAVKIREDDVAHWALHGALRRLLVPGEQANRVVIKGSSRAHAPDAEEVLMRKSRRSSLSGRAQKATAELIIQFGSEVSKSDPVVNSLLASSKDADQLIRRDPFAFLVGIICDGSSSVSSGWDIPYLLKTRLGHLDPYRIRAEYLALRRAMLEPTPLLAQVNDATEWIAEAADRVVRVYGGDAARIWRTRPNPTQLALRLQRFAGIGKTKSHIATELLSRFLKVEFSDGTESEGGFDNQVRRVFARVGLSPTDQREDVILAAKRLYPQRPLALDQSAWEIGRRWCTPSDPNCRDCILKSTCLRVAAGANSN